MNRASVVMVLLLLGCNGNSPTDPAAQPAPPTAAQPGVVWGYVKAPSGNCLVGAVVEVLDGPRAGDTSTQWDECGNVWDGGAYVFRDLPANTNVRMRASLAGYRSREMTFYPSNGSGGPSNFQLERE